MTVVRPDLRHVLAGLDAPEVRARGGAPVAALRADLVGAVVTEGSGTRLIVRGERALGRLFPFGSVALYAPSAAGPLRHRLLEMDRSGRVTLVIQRDLDGSFHGASVRQADQTWLGLLPGSADHPAWGHSDRVVRFRPDGSADLLTVCAAVAWSHLGEIPPLADPSRLPPGGGTSLLNVLAGLATDQAATTLRYRGPYPTEQLFWALLESFRVAPESPDPLRAFTEDAETTLTVGAMRAAPLDWTPAPHERLFEPDGVYVQLRDGVEKVTWEGRTYYRLEWQGLQRREHRVIRAVAAPDGRARFVASLEALGRSLEDHLVLDGAGNLLECHPDPSEAAPEGDAPLGTPWREALGALLPLEATPLLATAIATVWPAFRVAWGRVPRDLVETRGTAIRLSARLSRAYFAERAALPVAGRRGLAQRLVRELLGLVGPPVRQAAAAWLEAETPARRDAHLAAAAALDRRALAAHAAEWLGRLLTALEDDCALPASSTARV